MVTFCKVGWLLAWLPAHMPSSVHTPTFPHSPPPRSRPAPGSCQLATGGATGFMCQVCKCNNIICIHPATTPMYIYMQIHTSSTYASGQMFAQLFGNCPIIVLMQESYIIMFGSNVQRNPRLLTMEMRCGQMTLLFEGSALNCKSFYIIHIFFMLLRRRQ